MSYGLSSVQIFSEVGGVYLNFALWGVSILPAWLVIRHFGVTSASSDDEVSSTGKGGASDDGGTVAKET